MSIRRNRRSSIQSRTRRAAASVELAVVLPVILIVLAGTIEACSMMHLTESLYISSYEAARVSLIPRSQAADVENAARSILASRNIRDAVVTITPSDPAAVPMGQMVTVTVSAPATANSPMTSLFFRGRTMSGSCTMMKEY